MLVLVLVLRLVLVLVLDQCLVDEMIVIEYSWAGLDYCGNRGVISL